MKKHAPNPTLTILAIFSFFLLPSCHHNHRNYLSKVQLNNKYGCIDTLGREVIPLKYDDMGNWRENLIAVNIGARIEDYLLEGGKWGYCNTPGRLVIPLQYEKANPFFEHFAAVKTNGKWGFIDIYGKMVIAADYDAVRQFSNGLCAICKNNKWGAINSKGDIVIKPTYGALSDFYQDVAIAFVGPMITDENEVDIPEGYYCLIDKKGNILTRTRYSMIWGFQEGFAKIEIEDTARQYRSKTGFINTKGADIVPAVYDYAEDFNDGMAAVGITNKNDTPDYLDPNFSTGYVNTKGVLAIPVRYSQAASFTNGMATVSLGKKRAGFFVTDPIKDSIIAPSEQSRAGVIDKNGKYIIEPVWHELIPTKPDYYIASRLQFLNYGLIRKDGKVIVPFVYPKLDYAGNNILVGENQNEEQVVLNIQNIILLKTKKYNFGIPRYQYGLLQVRNNELKKYGFINLKGNEVIKVKYDYAGDFECTE